MMPVALNGISTFGCDSGDHVPWKTNIHRITINDSLLFEFGVRCNPCFYLFRSLRRSIHIQISWNWNLQALRQLRQRFSSSWFPLISSLSLERTESFVQRDSQANRRNTSENRHGKTIKRLQWTHRWIQETLGEFDSLSRAFWSCPIFFCTNQNND